MHKTTLFLLFVLLSIQSFGQTLGYKRIGSYDLAYLLNNIEETKEFKAPDSDLAVRVYFVSDPSGSAQTGESDEVTTSLYFAVSEYGERPEQHVYRLTSLYNPKFVKWVKDIEEPKLIITYDSDNKRKTTTIQVALKKLIIVTE